MENGTRKISNPHYANTYNTLYKYDSHSVVLADLLYKTKPHYSEDHTMRICTMRGPPVSCNIIPIGIRVVLTYDASVISEVYCTRVT